MARHSSPRIADHDFIRIHAASPPSREYTESFSELQSDRFATLQSPETTYSVSAELFRDRAADGSLPKNPWGAAARRLNHRCRKSDGD